MCLLVTTGLLVSLISDKNSKISTTQNQSYKKPDHFSISHVINIIQIQMLRGPSSLSITVKLIILYILLLVDIVLSSFIQPTFNLQVQSQYSVAIVLIPLQVALLIVIIVMVTVLIWQTFLLRYGLIRLLAKEFLLPFSLILVVLGFSIAQRLVRLVSIVQDQSSINGNQLDFWNNNPTYQALYYIRFILYPIFYGYIIDISIRLTNPDYYQSAKWIQ